MTKYYLVRARYSLRAKIYVVTCPLVNSDKIRAMSEFFNRIMINCYS